MKWLSRLKAIIAPTLIISALIFAYSNFTKIPPEQIKEFINRGGVWSPLVYMLFHVLTIIFSVIGGGSFLVFSSGILFGVWPGIFYSILSAFIGASINFWLARYFGQKVIKNIIGEENMQKIYKVTSRITDKNPVILVPLMLTSAFNFVCYASGLTDIKYSKFMTSVAITSLVSIPVYVAIGSSLIQPNPLTIGVFFGLIILAVVVFISEERIRYARMHKTFNLQKIAKSISESLGK